MYVEIFPTNCKQNDCPQNSTSTININKCPPRWQQPVDGVKERPRSMDVHKLDVSQVFNNENKSVTGSNQDISKELEEIRWVRIDKNS